MLVQEILVEVDPALKNIVNPLSSIKTSIPKLDMKPSGVLDNKGNKIYNVVDKDGKVVKSFKGPNAEGNAETFRDKQNAKIRNQGINVGGNQTKAPDADDVDPKDQKIKDLEKSSADQDKKIKELEKQIKNGNKDQKEIKKWLRFSKWGPIGALFVTGYLSYDRIALYLDGYAKFLCLNKGRTDVDHGYLDKVRAYKARINADIGHGILQALGAAIAAVAAGATAGRILGGITSWVGGFVIFLISTGAGMLAVRYLEKLRDDDDYWDAKVASVVNGWVTSEMIRKLASRSDYGDCLADDYINDDIMIAENKTGRGSLKNAQKDVIIGDPQLMKAFKAYKKSKSAKSKASLNR